MAGLQVAQMLGLGAECGGRLLHATDTVRILAVRGFIATMARGGNAKSLSDNGGTAERLATGGGFSGLSWPYSALRA